MTTFKNILSALAMVAISSSLATAQTDFGGGTGAGAGAGGAFAPFSPGLRGFGGAPGLVGNGTAGLRASRSAFANASLPVRMVSPNGGNATLSAAFLNAVAGVMGGSPTAAQTATVTNALVGVPASAASALVAALQVLGATPSHASLSRAISAYNAAIDALPIGTTPPAALAAIRFALFGASVQ